ncbi:MAG TPA: MFS transporter [Dehalococcoidia bacterium]|nr:MFS transporter [Dehalococcoidia bacterium]
MSGQPASSGLRPLWLLLAGRFLSQLGDAIFLTTLLLWVADLTDSPAAVAGVFIASAIPVFLFSPFAGVYVDRWSYKRTLINCDLVRALLVLLLIFVESSDLLFLIYIDVFLISVASRFFTPAMTAAVPAIVPEDQVPRATSLMESTYGLTFVIGPALAAPLFALTGPEVALAINAFSYIPSVIAIWLCEINEESRERAGLAAESVRQEIVDGLKFIRRSRLQTTALLSATVLLLGGGMLDAVNVFFIDEALESSRSYVGVAESLQAAGYTLGSLALFWLAARARLWTLVALGMVGIGITTLVYSQMTALAPALIVYGAQGLPNGVAYSANEAFIVTRTTARFRGRVLSFHGMAAYGAVIIGAALGGLLAELMDVRWIVTLAALLFFVAGLYAFWGFSRASDTEKDQDENQALELDLAVSGPPSSVS